MVEIQSLMKVQMFQGLSQNEISQIAPFFSEEIKKKGEYIISEGKKDNSMFILHKGSVKITKQLILKIANRDRDEKVLASIDATNHPVFGEIGILGVTERTANVIATADCFLYKLSGEKFDKLHRKNIHAAYIIMRNMAETIARRLKSTDDDVVKLATALSLAVFR